MYRLYGFIRKIFRLLRSDGREHNSKLEELPAKEEAAKELVKKPAKKPAKQLSAQETVDYGNPFLSLPNELLLEVAEYLDEEFQALLSLSCTRLRVLLNSYLDLSLNDVSVKLRFLRYLERDYPDLLICPSCAFLYKWRSIKVYQFACPRNYHHSPEKRTESHDWHLKGGQSCFVSRHVIDLIFRAQERGRRYGLPLSFFSSTMTDENWMTITNEARLVDGQLLLASCWELDLDSRQDMLAKAHLFESALCLHLYWNILALTGAWQTMEEAVAGIYENSEKPRVSKCPYCALDYSLDVQKRAHGQMRMVLKVYRNFGRRYARTPASEQLFHSDRSLRSDADELSRRDLQALFGRTPDSFAH